MENPEQPAEPRLGAALGAIVVNGGVEFRVWAPTPHSVAVLFADGRVEPLTRDSAGYFSGVVAGAKAGDRYKFQIGGPGDDAKDQTKDAFPDPASRYQPEGVHSWSEVVDEAAYGWSAAERGRRGLRLTGQVIYELHIGTFTAEGTYRAAEAEFARLADLGITVLEIMPLAEFPGAFGWGYDGVYLFAPYHGYGTVADLKHMVEAAHSAGLAVILDVVYNHFGPDGNYISQFSKNYFSSVETEWGCALNFDEDGSEGTREFFLQNAEYWIRDFHFDGLRLDATQAIHDKAAHGRRHILAEIAHAARSAAGDREIILVSECERQECRQISEPGSGGFGLDGMWNDDLHHSAMVRLTGNREAYYSDHLGRAQEFVSAAKWGFLYQGQFYAWQQAPRGTSFLNRDPWHMISFLENHDQVANSTFGLRPRERASAGKYRAMTAYWLMMPATPMFFMGQEYGTTQPFYYFADHETELREKVRAGREEFLAQFDSMRNKQMRDLVPDPGDAKTFEDSKLDHAEAAAPLGQNMQALHRDLLKLRREDPALMLQRKGSVDGAVLTDDCFVLRFFLPHDQDRLMIVNFGSTLDLVHMPEPLLAAPGDRIWRVKWSSEDASYGGGGVTNPMTQLGWRIGAESTILLEPADPEAPRPNIISERA